MAVSRLASATFVPLSGHDELKEGTQKVVADADAAKNEKPAQTASPSRSMDLDLMISPSPPR
jgi:hypothetical protein